MKAPTLKSAAVKLSVVFFTIFLLAGSVNAEENGKKQLNSEGIKNYLAGIQSKNYGVKRDCIYFSALYDIKEAVDILAEELESEKDPRTCVLISLAIYRLNGSNSADNNLAATLNDWNDKVHFLSDEIVTSLLVNSASASSNNGK